MVSVSSTEYPPSASLVSMNGPSVTPLARTVLAVAGGASWCPLSTSLPEPPPAFSYQAPISAYHAWPSASDMVRAASVSRSRITYFTVASICRRGATMASLHQFHERRVGPSDITGPQFSRVPYALGHPRLHGQDGLVAPLDVGPVAGFRHRALAGPVDHGGLLEQHRRCPSLVVSAMILASASSMRIITAGMPRLDCLIFSKERCIRRS